MRAKIAVALMAAAIVGSSCGRAAIDLTYRPRPGARATYRVHVRAVVVTTVAGHAARRTVDEETFTARHRVLSGGRAPRVEVRITGRGITPRVFVVRIDRAGQLVAVDRAEGLPADVLGGLGLSEIFPAAAGAPPAHPLKLGQAWTIDQDVDLGAGPGGRLRGRARLGGFSVTGGRDVAKVAGRYTLNIARTGSSTEGRVTLQGVQETVERAGRDITDGVVETIEARTSGHYQLGILPPLGTTGPTIPGTVVVDLVSESRRIA